ncbi:MAG: ATP-binding protein, partial [Thaumarchaeota archaeon]
MYFDPAPKTKRKDLYNFDEELRKFIEAINGSDRLILVTGLRRTGKT